MFLELVVAITLVGAYGHHSSTYERERGQMLPFFHFNEIETEVDHMKKIVSSLFILQLLVVGFYGLTSLRSVNFHHLVFEGNSMMMLNFGDNLDHYDFFLDLIDEHELIASRIIHPNASTTAIYTTDVTLGGRVTLIEGVFPQAGTSDFMSTFVTEEEAQVGLMADVIPEHQVIIADMRSPQNFVLDGFYYISTTDEAVLTTLLSTLEQAGLRYIRYSAIGIPGFMHAVLSLSDHEGIAVLLPILEFLIIFPVITLCFLASVIQYALSQLKQSMTFFVHGYSKKKIVLLVFWDMGKVLLTTSIATYAISIFYLISTNQWVFWSSFTTFFLLFDAAFMLICFILVSLIMIFSLQRFNPSTALKGKKFDRKIQAFNHLTKGAFTGAFLLLLSLSIWNWMDLNRRLDASLYWEQAQNVYRITVSPAPMDWEILTQFNDEMIAFYHDLMEHHDGFMINSMEVLMHDWRIDDDDEDWGLHPDEVVYPWEGQIIRINPSFLHKHPIVDFNGESVYDHIIDDDYVLNVLLPERFRAYEAAFHDVFLNIFQGWNDLNNIPDSEERRLNVIHVPDGQYYFSFNSQVRVADGNRIRDPIVIIHQGRFAEFSITSSLTLGVYFVAETSHPFREIEPLIQYHGLESEIQRLEAIYDNHVREVNAMQGHQLRLGLLVVLLLVVNLSVAYNLIANYFERHKFEIFLKSTFGWHIFKRNGKFLMTYLAYTLPLITFVSFIIGWDVALIGVAMLGLDVTIMLFFEQRLIKKSFSEIMKGER